MSSKPAVRPRPPSVEAVLKELRPTVDGVDPDALAATVREVVAEERSSLAGGSAPRDTAALAEVARSRLETFVDQGLMPVINATGVIIHTNLGRAPWPSPVAAAVAGVVKEPLLLELDRETGRRGQRARVAEHHLVALTGAEDGLVTNNNAAAVALAVGLAGRGGVVVSRGELVEIGLDEGPDRDPDVVHVEPGSGRASRGPDAADGVEAVGNGALDLREAGHTAGLVAHDDELADLGGRDESPGASGAAHFLEHMMFKGSARFGPGEIDRRTQALGGINNAFTSHDATAYYFAFASDRWHEALAIERDRLTALTLDPAEIASERQVILEELAMYRDEPWDALELAVQAELFATHPYGVPVLGSEIVGLVPQGALNAVADFYLQLENFSENQILEHRLEATMEEAQE